ncbi:tRNA pseudouridine(38-40) synthase [hydrothermal vent metagenome]|uniref:tRNA pseudouridine(38-40) synthase n=1 Tax=hydrothermal vent metagenome TaxID=652676 RepID=A0A3B1AYU1_9ZZZZ
MSRITLGVEYDGAGFCGWQIQQPDIRTVQGVLEQALSRVANGSVRVHCAGRTDTGVHGVGQVVHFDTEAQRSSRSWVLGANSNLPFDVNVNWAKLTADPFHARFSAISRAYRYVILNRQTRSSLQRKHAVWIHHPLDADCMHEAAQQLVGTHDFSSYRALGCQAHSPVRTIDHLDVRRQGDRIIIKVGAEAFLHHMVRNIAGVLMAIGRGDQDVNWAYEVLQRRDRTQGGVTAPPEGLYLMHVGYPEHFEIPEPPEY